MTEPPITTPPLVNYQGIATVDRDAEHIRILSICWYIASGMAALFGCLPILYVVLGLMVIIAPGAFAGGRGAGPPPPAFMGWMFVVMGGIFLLFLWGSAVIGFLTARALPKRKALMVCYVASALACMQIPVGTVLGIFTIIVLSRPGVRASFR
jgi:hypothetical protein